MLSHRLSISGVPMRRRRWKTTSGTTFAYSPSNERSDCGASAGTWPLPMIASALKCPRYQVASISSAEDASGNRRSVFRWDAPTNGGGGEGASASAPWQGIGGGPVSLLSHRQEPPARGAGAQRKAGWQWLGRPSRATHSSRGAGARGCPRAVPRGRRSLSSSQALESRRRESHTYTPGPLATRSPGYPGRGRMRKTTLATCNLNQFALDFEGNLQVRGSSDRRARGARRADFGGPAAGQTIWGARGAGGNLEGVCPPTRTCRNRPDACPSWDRTRKRRPLIFTGDRSNPQGPLNRG